MFTGSGIRKPVRRAEAPPSYLLRGEAHGTGSPTGETLVIRLVGETEGRLNETRRDT